MIGYEIENIIKTKTTWGVKKLFRGVFSSDNLPKYLPFGQSHTLICNHSPAQHPGTHWVAMFISNFGELTYFDSFGRPPLNDDIKNFVCNNSLTLIYNKVPLQGAMTRTCGLYCLYFIIKCCEGLDLPRILSVFNPFQPEYNDRFILNYFFEKTFYNELL